MIDAHPGPKNRIKTTQVYLEFMKVLVYHPIITNVQILDIHFNRTIFIKIDLKYFSIMINLLRVWPRTFRIFDVERQTGASYICDSGNKCLSSVIIDRIIIIFFCHNSQSICKINNWNILD